MSRFSLLLLFTASIASAQETDNDTGLIIADGWNTVRSTCTECHSAQLITQNSGSRAVWLSRINWMQETQGLQELTPEVEEIILHYLELNYGPKQASRRPAIPSHLMPANPYPVDQ